MEELLDSRRKRSEAVANLETSREQALQRTTQAQADAAALLTDEDVTRMVHEAR
jgi:hypothetical protein